MLLTFCDGRDIQQRLVNLNPERQIANNIKITKKSAKRKKRKDEGSRKKKKLNCSLVGKKMSQLMGLMNSLRLGEVFAECCHRILAEICAQTYIFWLIQKARPLISKKVLLVHRNEYNLSPKI